MNELRSTTSEITNKVYKYHWVILGVIGTAGILVRLYYFPFELPITHDAQHFFWYAIDMTLLGNIPPGYNFPNTGWPSFLSIFFSLSNSNYILDYMSIQRYLTVIISVATIFPVYLLCRKFVSIPYSLIGGMLFVFSPRLILDSLEGGDVTLFFCLGAISLCLFLSDKKRFVYTSFVIAALFAIVRYEGLLLIIPLLIMFFIRFRKEKSVIPKMCILLIIFVLILLPVAYMHSEATKNIQGYLITGKGHDSFLSHGIIQPTLYLQNTVNNEGFSELSSILSKGGYNLIQYFGWVMLPLFIFFVPAGFLFALKERDYKKTTIILFIICFLIPAFYAYSRGIQDTKYLYVLYPIFSILSILTIYKIQNKLKKPILIGLAVIVLILTGSIGFVHEKSNLEHDYESLEIAKEISDIANGVNKYYPESKYLIFLPLLNNDEFPVTVNKDIKERGIKQFEVDKHNSLEEFIQAERNNELTHIVVDGNKSRISFLKEIFYDEKIPQYLKKELDTLELGFNYHVKVYKINYKIFDSVIEKKI